MAAQYSRSARRFVNRRRPSAPRIIARPNAPVAQLDRVAASEAAGRWFESSRARHLRKKGHRITIKVLYTAHATADGGRNGHTQSSDGQVSVDLSVPRAMGGPGRPNTTTPEELFAAGYAACFGSAVEFVSRQMKLHPRSISVQAAVGIGEDSGGGFGLKVDLIAQIAGVSQAQAERLVQAGHEVCPYSKATRGNIEVSIKAQAL
jgi:lipoyl-dependent peroxiredoxin